MTDLLIAFLGISGAQIFVAVTQAWILFWFADELKMANLRSFGLSMILLALGWVGFLASYYLYSRQVNIAPEFRLLMSWLTQFGYLGHFAMLLVGTLEAITGRIIGKSSVTVTAAILGASLVLPFAFDPQASDERLLLRIGAHYLVGTVAFTGIALFASRAQIAGFRFVRNGAAVAAVAQASCLALFSFQYVTRDQYGGPLTPLLELAGTASICAGLLLWLLEETRQKGVRVSSDLHRLTHYDRATGLANAEFLNQHMRQCIEQKSGHVLLVIDLDHFRNIGDSLKQAQADQVFREVAARIKSQLPADAQLARLKHDTFAAFFSASEAKSVEDIALGIQQALAPEMRIGDRQLFLTGSIGMALEPTDAVSGEELLKAAQLALHQCKSMSRGQYRFYAPVLNEQANRRLAMTAELRRAVNEEQFVLHFQPIVDLQGRIQSFEALIRWNHPERGLLQPAEFVGNLEAAGISLAIDRLVLRQALEAVKGWRLQFHQDYSMAVNISASSFQDSTFPAYLAHLLNDLALSATAVELEITESTALENLDLAMAMLGQLRGLGVRVSLDDFGTGFSSLSHLRVLPINRIKIDRSFVRDVPADRKDGAIVAAIIELAHSLDLTVIAEGVETQDQRAFLDAHGVDLLQGYLLYRPKPAEAIQELLARGGKRLSIVNDQPSFPARKHLLSS